MYINNQSLISEMIKNKESKPYSRKEYITDFCGLIVLLFFIGLLLSI